MLIYIPQVIDPYNTHLSNLIHAYKNYDNNIIVGYDNFGKFETMPTIVHFHMIEGILKHLGYNYDLFFEILKTYKLSGTKIIYTVHNILPHRPSTTIDYNSIFRKFFDFVDLFVHHGKLSIDYFKQRFQTKNEINHIVCHHGDYLANMRDFKENKSEARAILKFNKESFIILVFGQLQYKNTSFSEEVFNRARKKNRNIYIVYAGISPKYKYNIVNNFYYKFNNLVLNSFRVNKKVVLKRFSQYETYLLFKSANVIFLPHNLGLTTGLIPLAATLKKPFIYPDIGVFSEQAQNCIAEKYICNDISSAQNALENILSANIDEFDNTDWLIENNWNNYVKNILNELKNYKP